MSDTSKQYDAETQTLSQDLPAQPTAVQIQNGLKPVNTVPDDVESQLGDLAPLFDGPSPPHPHPHFSGRAPWLRAGGCLASMLLCLAPLLLLHMLTQTPWQLSPTCMSKQQACCSAIENSHLSAMAGVLGANDGAPAAEPGTAMC